MSITVAATTAAYDGGKQVPLCSLGARLEHIDGILHFDRYGIFCGSISSRRSHGGGCDDEMQLVSGTLVLTSSSVNV